MKKISAFYIFMALIAATLLSWKGLEAFLEAKNTLALNDYAAEAPKISLQFNNALHIEFDFKQTGRLGDYDNLFQTGAVNSGARLETTTGGWGLVFSHQDGALHDLRILTVPAFDVFHHIAIDISRSRVKDPYDPINISGAGSHAKYNVSAAIDGHLAAKGVWYDLSIATDDIAVGTGFSKTRPFQGEIKNFRISSPPLPSPARDHVFYGLLALLSAAGACSRLRQVRSNFRRPSRRAALAAGLGLAAAAGVLNRLWPLAGFLKGQPFSLYFYYWYFSLLVLSALNLFLKRRLGVGPAFSFYALGLIYAKSFFIIYNLQSLLGDVVMLAAAVVALHKLARPAGRAGKTALALGALLHYATLFIIFTGAAYVLQHRGIILRLNVGQIAAGLETNLSEALNFYLSQLSPPLLALIFCGPALMSYFLAAFYKRAAATAAPPSGGRPLGPFALPLLIVAGVYLNIQPGGPRNLFYTLAEAKIRYDDTQSEYRHYAALRAAAGGGGLAMAHKAGQGELYVLVIGESASRDHFGAYGYFRATDPWLAGAAAAGEAVLFQNAYAPYSHTTPALLKVLTSANQYNGQPPFAAPSLIEVFKNAGFAVHHLSAANLRHTITANPLSALLDQADTSRYLMSSLESSTDPELLPPLAGLLQSLNPQKNNLVILHLGGSHFNYALRLNPAYHPEIKRAFTGDNGLEYLGGLSRRRDFLEKALNPYDRTILSTDWLLRDVDALLNAAPQKVKGLIYFSDHGEDVFGENFHDASLFAWPMARVPLFFKFSPAWREAYAAKDEALRASADKIFTTDCFFDLMLNLADVETAVYEPQYDPLSPDYAITLENAVTMTPPEEFLTDTYVRGGQLKIADDPLLIARSNLADLEKAAPGRFLALHADAIGMAYDAIRLGFKGVEVNVIFHPEQPERLEMGHGDDWVKQPNDLAHYLSAVPLKEFSKLYIDTKRFDGRYAEALIEVLEKLEAKFSFKAKAIIETNARSEKMALFAERGWTVSFYYIPQQFPPSPETAAILIDALKKQKAANLSFPYPAYGFIKEYVEPFIPAEITYNTWAAEDMPSIYDKDFMEKLAQRPLYLNERFKTVLIGSGSNFYISLTELKPR